MQKFGGDSGLMNYWTYMANVLLFKIQKLANNFILLD